MPGPTAMPSAQSKRGLLHPPVPVLCIIFLVFPSSLGDEIGILLNLTAELQSAMDFISTSWRPENYAPLSGETLPHRKDNKYASLCRSIQPSHQLFPSSTYNQKAYSRTASSQTRWTWASYTDK